MNELIIVLFIMLGATSSLFFSYLIYFLNSLNKHIYIYNIKVVKDYRIRTICQFTKRKVAYQYCFHLRKSGTYCWVERFLYE